VSVEVKYIYIYEQMPLRYSYAGNFRVLRWQLEMDGVNYNFLNH
jgi:hypothetical protein